MNKSSYALICAAVLLSACSKESAAPVPAPAPAPAAAATAPAPAASAPADLPKECQDYLDKVAACMTKQGPAMAESAKTSMQQARAAWASFGADTGQLARSCKASSDAFAAQASAMNC